MTGKLSGNIAGSAEYEAGNRTHRVCDMPDRVKPREEMDRLGVEHVSDDVLLSILLRSGVRGINVVDLAAGLLRDYGSLTALAGASASELAHRRGMGKVKAQVVLAALELGARLGQESEPRRYAIRTPEDVSRLLAVSARKLDHEIFWVLLLDAKNRLKGRPLDITRGLLDASLVHPREVFRDAIRSAAAAIVVAHNHPSGDPTPSAEDLRITRQLVEAGRVVDIRVLDHVVLGRESEGDRRGFLSMRESGLVEFSGNPG